MSEVKMNVDARRALGRRPGALPPPKLYIDEAPLEDVPTSPSMTYPPSPTSRHLSLAIPSSPSAALQSPTSPTTRMASAGSRRFRRPTISRPKLPPPQTKGLYETQKLLSHLLDRLESRDSAPDLLDRAAIAARRSAGYDKEKSKSRGRMMDQVMAAASSSSGSNSGPYSTSRPGGIGSEDFDDRLKLEEGQWDTEAVHDLVEQLIGLLVIADKQGLIIFGISASGMLPPSPSRIKKKGRMSSFTSASPSSPTREESQSSALDTASSMSGPHLLTRTMSILKSLIHTDCLHRTLRFRPLCPPNALQSACLDLASYLYHQGELKLQIEIVDTIMDGFYGMGEGTSERLCAWVEGRLGELLRRLAKERGGQIGPRKDSDWADPFATRPSISQTGFGPSSSLPTFAFSVDSTNPDPMKEPTQAQGWVRYSPTTQTFPTFNFTNEIAGLLSTHSDSRDASNSALLIAALVPKLLVALTSTIDLRSTALTTIHRVHRLLSLVLIAKPDSALDLLEIVALAPPGPRKTALEILATFYPESMGHNSIARRLALSTYEAQLSKWETGQDRSFGEDGTDNHHYIPWRSFQLGDHGGTSCCSACRADLQGFSIKCTLCDDIRHLYCYQPPDEVFVYNLAALSSATETSQTIYVKFSKCITRLDEKVLNGSTKFGNAESTIRKVGQHYLHLVNLFNLALCECCKEPLWGSAAQAYACFGECQRFFHPRCVDDLVPSARCRHVGAGAADESGETTQSFAISLASLRSSWSKVRSVIVSDDELSRKSYDEVAILHGTLWLQYQLYKNGLASGSIRPISDQKRLDPDILSFRQTLKTYEDVLAARVDEASSAVTDFAHVSQIEPPSQGYLFSTRYLTYCAALLRAPSVKNDTTLSPGLLLPGLAPDLSVSIDDTHSGSYEMLSLSTVSQGLSTDLNISDPDVSATLLNHMKLLGLLSISSTQNISPGVVGASDVWCLFPLPFLIDSSPTVEILILAIEALLDSLDLTQTEQALRLLVRRAWPSLLCSPYALERLGNAVVAWIIAEDVVLHELVKNYASQRKRLPGVRADHTSQVKGSTSVADYKEARQNLLSKHARPWLFALHQQDPALYAHILYEQCKLQAKDVAQGLDLGIAGDVDDASQVASIALDRIATLTDVDVVFSASLDLLTAWLEDLGTFGDQDVVYKSLPRLIRQSDSGDRNTNIWSLARSTHVESSDGLESVCRWMRVLSYSGVEIPWEVLTDLLDSLTTSVCCDEAVLDLVTAVGFNSTEIETAAFATLCNRLLTNLTSNVTGRRDRLPAGNQELELLRRSFVLVLRAYGVSHDDVLHSALHVGKDLDYSPANSGKKRLATSSRGSLPLDEGTVLATASLLGNPAYRKEPIMDFLWLLFSKSSVLNVEEFVYTCSRRLYESLWPMYDLQVDRKCRARLFLRFLSINSSTMEELVWTQLASEQSSHIRERLLTFVLDLADGSVSFETRGWQTPAVGLINMFFNAVLDPNSSIPDDMVILQSLVPTSLLAVSRCFEESLVQSSEEKRLSLVNQMRQLRMSFPAWPILPWRVVEELVTEQVAAITHLRPVESTQAKSALHDAQLLRCSLLALGLDMLSTGIPITWIAAQRFQQHVASVSSLPWSMPIEGVISLILPSLRQVLDSPVRISVGMQSGDVKSARKTTLIGALFVPVVIDFGTELLRQDVMTQRSLLDILMVTFFKQNTLPVELAALAALQSLADFARSGQCSENRLLAISILQTATDRVGRDSLTRVVPTLFNTVASILICESKDGGDTAVHEQAKILLLSMIRSFGRSGLYLQLLKNDGLLEKASKSDLGHALLILQAERQKDSTDYSGSSIVDAVFTNLPDALKRGRSTVTQVLLALERYTSVVNVSLSDEAVEGFGLFLNRLGKHVADWDASEFDPNPILKTVNAVLNLASQQAAITLLHQGATLLHLSLSRFDVHNDTLSDLSSTSSRISARGSTENSVRAVLYELSTSAINGLAVTMTTLQSLLLFLTVQTSLTSTFSTSTTNRGNKDLAEACPGCMTILLRTHSSFQKEGKVPTDLVISVAMAAAGLLVKAEDATAGSLTQALTITSESASVQLSVFSFVLLAATEDLTVTSPERILTLYPIIGRAISLGLRGCTDLLTLHNTSGDGAELLSSIFVVFRLLILLEGKARPEKEDPQSTNGRDLPNEILAVLWNRIWPDLSRLVTLSIDEACVNGPLRAVTNSVFLDIIIFLSSTKCPILAAQSMALSQLLRQIGYGTANAGSSTKYQKATMVIENAGISSGVVDRRSLLSALKGDLLATERLRSPRSGP